MSGGVVSGPAVRDTTPDPDDFGMVVRGVGTFPVFEPLYQRRFDIFVSSATLIYVGYAAQGVATAAAAWLIKRITFSGGNPTATQWSGTTFTAIWDNRGAIPYF